MIIGLVPLMLSAAPTAREGLIDLSDWDFHTDGVVRLDGQYEFFWEKLYERRDLLAAIPDAYIDVPAPWNDNVIQGQTIGGHGYGTYKLTILLPRQERLALKFLDFGTSFWAHIDDALVLTVGQPGRTRDETIGSYEPQLIEFEPAGTRVELILHVANFDHRAGGAWSPVLLGTPEQIHQLRENGVAAVLFLVGAIVMVGLFNFAIFALRRNNRSGLFLGLICLAACARLLTVDERYAYVLLPEIPWTMFTRIEYVSWYLLLPTFAHFLYHTFPRQVNRFAIYLVDFVSLAAIILVMTTRLDHYSESAMPMIVFHLGGLVWGSWFLFAALRDREEGASLLTAGYLVLGFTLVNDVLAYSRIIDSVDMVGFGILAFVICQSFVVIYQFANTLRTVEQQHEELLQTNLKLQMQEKLRQEAESESRSVSQRFRKSQQFEALGILAHDVVSRLKDSFSEAAEVAVRAAKEMRDSPDLASAMERIRTSSQQGIGVIEDLLSLTRLQDHESYADINHVINAYLDSDASAELMDQAGIRFSIERMLGQDVRPVAAAPLHIRRILENLLRNAVDSLNEGGQIQVGTEEVRVRDGSLFYDELPAGIYIVLSVEDNGTGVDAHDLDLVFQPFFSRKAESRYSRGLGMAVVRAIVHQLGGGVDVVSEKNSGTRFEVYLPARLS
ncbi:MAG: ATP-binding protein [Proteobacteria bacterium]|nr:ATP-binding protein [Pseudomonadota bacterium]